MELKDIIFIIFLNKLLVWKEILMLNIMQRIAHYFKEEYNGDDDTAQKLSLSPQELRDIININLQSSKDKSRLNVLKNRLE